MNQLIKNHRVLLVGGPGGVGKTTLSATLGIQLARMGYKTVVLTVDPAKRLAQALGFSSFEQEVQKVPLAEPVKGELYASMLDSQRYFDKIIERFAKTAEQRESVLNHPIYRTMVDSLGGTQEYAAMERLLEFSESSSFEKIVVDTPPSQNAVELLSAPQRLADFMDNSVLKWFQKSSSKTARIFFKGTQLAMKALQKVFGTDFFQSFGTLVDNFDGMQAGFKKRHLQVLDLLKGNETAFLLVTHPSEARYLESVAFLETLQEQRIQLKAILLNRLEPNFGANLNSPGLSKEMIPRVDRLLSYYNQIYVLQQSWIEKFRTLVDGIAVKQIPRQEGEIHEVSSLSKLGSYLVSLENNDRSAQSELSKASPLS